MAKDFPLNEYDFPNALAKLHVSTKDESVKLVEVFSHNKEDDMAKKAKKDSSSSEASSVESIWKNIGIGKIDISYACVGYTMDGRPVLDHSQFVDLLINYGYLVTDALKFIDEFSSYSSKEKTSPIIMININVSRICTEIEPIVGNE